MEGDKRQISQSFKPNTNRNGQVDRQRKEGSIPLGIKGQQLARQVDEEIKAFKQQLESKSNFELKQIGNQLETVEREMLLEKIDNELQTIKETIVKPGDVASTAAAGAAAAAAATQAQSTSPKPADS